jgi:hypothetical protein
MADLARRVQAGSSVQDCPRNGARTGISGRLQANREGEDVSDSAVPPEPPRTPDDADLALAKVAVPWVGLHHIGGNKQLAQALTAWLQARGIY